MSNSVSDNSNNVNVMSEVTVLIRTWEDEHTQHNYNPINTLTRLAEIIEVETMNYLKMDPDPFDERHPSRTDPDCKLGQILKALFRKDNFMNKLVNDYLNDKYYSRSGIPGMDVDQLNIAGCRLMLDIMPGLEISVVFQPDMDSLIYRLIKWSTNSIEPLQSYATGILAAAMEIPEIATRFRESNAILIPLLLQRLHRLLNSSSYSKSTQFSRPFAHLSSLKSPPLKSADGIIKPPPPLSSNKRPRDNSISSPIRPIIDREDGEARQEGEACQKRKKLRLEYESANGVLQAPASQSNPQKNVAFTETSNSSWAELESFMIGTVQMFPPTTATRQILILRYLTPLGEYQEFLGHVFEHNALQLILSYVNVRETKEARLAFESLKYLASLLCHKKFAIEFIHCKGLEALLEVPRPSIAATGVSICLYYLGYCEEAMERVCLLPKYVLHSLVKYALWLLECSHDSGRCHAIMFFGLTFQFKIILEEFDSQDGLRLLHNVIATLPILLPDPDSEQILNEDQECAARQIVRHVCVALRRYLEAHLHSKVELIQRSQYKSTDRTSTTSGLSSQPGYIVCKSSPEEIQQQINTLLQNMPFRGHWSPVDQLLKHGCITLLLKIIAFAYEWNYSGRAETVRSALDVLAIACIMPKVQLLFCDKIDLPDESGTHGFNIILGAAEGEIVADADVQKAALRVIVNCVCAPINRVGGTPINNKIVATNSPNKKIRYKTSEELIEKIWDCVQSCSGILVLLSLMKVKTPITDADCIRTLACKALGGLARSETVRQIVSKLPLFISGQLQNLMREPILQEKRQEHVNFQKYALELLEKLSGKTKRAGNDLEVSLSNIHRANVVAQTKIQFNDRQLLQLIHQHLVSKGFVDTASLLVKEARLSHAITTLNHQLPLKFRYSSTLTPARQRLSFCSPISRTLSSPSITHEPAPSSSTTANNTAIKIVKKNVNPTPTTPTPNSRLQKQTTSDPHLRIKDVPLEENSPVLEQPRVSLDSIITEYLTNQHALCKNPMATCPQFNLFVPHKCPDPKPKLNYSYNVAIRSMRRQIGFQSKTLDRKFIHSRFCPVQTIRSTTEDGFFTCAKFMPGDQSIIVGDYVGEVRIFNLHTGNEESSFQAHNNYIVHIEPNRTGEFVLTSATWGRPVSAMWSLKDHQMKTPFDDEEYIEYSKATQDRILGTKGEVATIFDSNNGLNVSKLIPTNSNHYTKNKATFSPNDDLILTDGVLFDVASGKQIHKLDKLNQTQSGVFHPNGLEIVSNTEVWDLRTFKLLKTVPVLSQCSTVFSPINNAVYAISIEQELDDGDSTFDSSFKIVDSIDYSSTFTYDVKKNIYDLAVNRYDTQIAIVENQGMYQAVQESSVRIYDVGKKRADDDEQDEEEDDDDDDMDGSDDDDDDDLREENDNNDNNDNNDDDNQDDDDDDDDDDNSSDGSGDWSTNSFSDSDDSSIGNDSLLNELLFEL